MSKGFEDFLRDVLRDPERISNALDKLSAEGDSEGADFLKELAGARTLGVILTFNGQEIAREAILVDGGKVRFNGLHPGAYALSLSTGWLFWERELSAAELLVPADSEKLFDMAADSGESEQAPSLGESLNCGLRLRVYAGLGSGQIELMHQ